MPAPIADLPSALERFAEIRRRSEGKQIILFLDYDGTLTPIMERPDLAVLARTARETLRRLAGCVKVAVISGRDLRDIRRLVAIDNIFYSGSHGFEIEGPEGWRLNREVAADFLPSLDGAERELRVRLRGVDGVLVERKKFSIAVHYRLVGDADLSLVKQAVEETAANHPDLRRASGKKVFELQPKLDWNKGKAVLWLLRSLDLNPPDVLPIFIGDDITDEDAFEAVRERGIGIVVGGDDRPSAATYALESPDEVLRFLDLLCPP